MNINMKMETEINIHKKYQLYNTYIPFNWTYSFLWITKLLKHMLNHMFKFWLNFVGDTSSVK